MSDYIKHKEYKLPNGRTVTADFNELGHATITIQAMDALFDILNSSDVIEVVRCKDCKWRYSTSDCTHWLPCMDIIYNHDFYCGYGERAEA